MVNPLRLCQRRLDAIVSALVPTRATSFDVATLLILNDIPNTLF